MKKIIVSFMFLLGAFKLNAMNRYNNWEFGGGIDICNYNPWQETKQKLFELGMKQEDLNESIPKDYPLEELELTDFWKEKEKASQEEKDQLFKDILQLNYTDYHWNVLRLHIASAVFIGANPDMSASGATVLSRGCSHKDIELVSFLLQKGANPNVWNAPMPLNYSRKNEKLTRLLLSFGADPEKHHLSKIQLGWCQNIRMQMQKEQEDGLKFLSAKVVLKN